jgi:hypothetical protein
VNILVWFSAVALAGERPPHPYTEAAVAYGDATCTVWVTSAPRPTHEIDACPEPFQDAAVREATRLALEQGGSARTRYELMYVAPVLARAIQLEGSLDDAVLAERAPRVVFDKDYSSREAGKRQKFDVVFFVDAQGRPFAVDLTECPESLRGIADLRLLGWQFEPVEVDGSVHPVRFEMPVKLR